ncbi:MAG: 60S ribosomal protein L31 [Nanoarchaeota archaeon]|nr:60S ribosomal protein L31 [Nanoarchaeota archaeon]
MATVQRTYIVPLRKGYANHANWKRSKKAVTVLKSFLVRHTKREDIKIGGHLNEYLWKHGIKNPPGKVKVDVWIKDEYAEAELSGFSFKGAAKIEKKKEEGGLKDKLAKKLGVDKEEDKDSKDNKDTKKEEKTDKKDAKPAKEDKKEVKTEKKEAKKETPIKKEEKK